MQWKDPIRLLIRETFSEITARVPRFWKLYPTSHLRESSEKSEIEIQKKKTHTSGSMIYWLRQIHYFILSPSTLAASLFALIVSTLHEII